MSAAPATAAAPTAGTPAASTAMDVDADPYTIREGKAIIRRPPKEETAADSSAASSQPHGIPAPLDDGGEVDGADGQAVFYNKVQVFNRDLSILMIQTFVAERKVEFETRLVKRKAKLAAYEIAVKEAAAAGKRAPPPPMDPSYEMPTSFPGITILEALSATGLRSIRYFKEIGDGDVKSIIVNDMDAEAVKSIEYNIHLNGLTTAQLIPSHADAITLMQRYRPPPMGPQILERPCVIDLDPYGTAAPFMDSAVQAIDEGGLLCITCTDKAILCGNYSETCFAKYGSMPLKGNFCHETAIRLVLNCISSASNRYGRHIVPLLSMSIDFYVRVFVRVYTAPQVVKKQAQLAGMILACTGCESFWDQPMGKSKVENGQTKYTPNTLDHALTAGCKCPHCGGTLKMGGPFWLGPLHSKEFIGKALGGLKKDPSRFATHTRILGSLTVTSEEVQDAEERKMVDKKMLNERRLKEEQERKKGETGAAAASATAASASAAAPAAAASSTTAASSSDDKKSASSTRKEEGHSSLLYYSLPNLFQLVNSSCPKISLIRSALINAGYAVSQTHCAHDGLKTNAPSEVVWDVVRSWMLKNPPKNGQRPGSVGERIMAKAPTLKADFTYVKGSDLSSTATGVAKFLPNPEENWGPKARAGSKRKTAAEADPSKRQKLNQNKRSRTRQCKIFAETGSCKFDVGCKFAHVPGAKAGEDVSARLSESLSTGEIGSGATSSEAKADEDVTMT